MMEAGYDVSEWIPAVVPGAVFTSYVEAGIEPDPNFGDNAYRADRKKYDRNFWYRTELATEEPSGGRALLALLRGGRTAVPRSISTANGWAVSTDSWTAGGSR